MTTVNPTPRGHVRSWARTLLRALGWAAGAAASLALVALAWVYLVSEWMLRRHYDDVPLQPLPVVSTPEDLEEGRRLAVIVGCWAGCHGTRGEGGTEDVEGVFEITAPPLGSVVPAYSDAELARLVRYGIKRDGKSAVGMISGTFYPLSDRDLARIVAHLRSQPEVAPVPRTRRIHLLGRIALATGKWHTSAGEVDRTMPRWGELPQRTPFERGRYLASITCSECHGLDFRGEEVPASPSLVVVRAYSRPQFRRLLRTGVALEERDLGLMSWVARNAFRELSDAEIDALHEFLSTGIDGGAGSDPLPAR